MELEDITQKDVTEKLTQLRTLMPNESEEVYHFADYLASQLKDTSCYSAPNFLLDASLALNDLKHGINSATRKPMCGELVGLPKENYTNIRERLPDIATAIYGKANLAELEKFFELQSKKD